MPRFGRSEPAISFWRCARCGTPNPWASYLINCLGCGAPRPSPPAFRSSRAKRVAGAALSRVRPIGGRWVPGISWAYALAVLVVLAMIRWLGDRWWPATVLEFMPRWLLLVPVAALAAIAGWVNRRRLWALQGATALVVVGPLMGLSLPVGQLWTFHLLGPRIRIVTLNQAAHGLNAYKLMGLIETQRIQLICFQEGHTDQEGTPDPVLERYLSKGWYRNRQRSIASRFPIVEELEPLDNPDGDETFWRARVTRARIRAPSGSEFVLASVHMPSMYYALNGLPAGDIENMNRHIAWRAQKMGLVVADLAQSNDLPLLVGGDFNMPSDSPLMSSLKLGGLRFGFDEAGWGLGYTRPSSIPWVRIDHILATAEWTFTRCWVGPNLGSDHLPLLAEVILSHPTAPHDQKPERTRPETRE